MVLNPYAIPGIKECDKQDILSVEAKIDRIITKVCNFYNVDSRKLKERTRKRNVVIARHFCTYFLRTNLNLSLKHIGEIMGGRDHTTSIHAINNIKDQLSIKVDTPMKDDYAHLIKII